MEEHEKNKMDGYFVSNTGSLKIRATNIPEFEILIAQAAKEAKQLNDTLQKLSTFDLNIDFEASGPTSES